MQNKQKESTINVYFKEGKRIAFFTKISGFEMKMNRISPATQEQQQKGKEWHEKATELTEELAGLMGRDSRKEALEWAILLLEKHLEEEEK